MYDALIISDIHLGSDNCQAKQLAQFLESIHTGDTLTKRLILNGDVFDSIDFRRLKKNHWKILSLLRKLSDDIEIIWLNGNHDGPAEIVSHLLGVEVRDEIILETGRKRVLVLHGHIFDEFIDNHPIITWIADRIYNWLQKIDKSHYFAKQAKQRSKMFLRCTQQIQEKSVLYAAKLGCQAVCCGHTHMPIAVTTGKVEYYNSGCWTEKPCHYLTVQDGIIEVRSYEDIPVPEEDGFAPVAPRVPSEAVSVV